MTTVKELRERCDKLRINRKEDLKSVLNDYFESAFISAHRPWRAVIGNKKCKPIPVHRDFCFFDEESHGYKFKWPNFSEEVLRKELENLGFVIATHRISLTVPAFKKGDELTFAQEWVKKINTSYSEYCANEKKVAKEVYSELISKMLSAPSEHVKTCDGYTFFSDFKVNREVSRKCVTFIRRLMLRDGIEEHYENGEFKGLKVLHQHPN